MLIKFDFSSKKGVLVVKYAFATAILKIETLRMRRRFCMRVFAATIARFMALDLPQTDFISRVTKSQERALISQAARSRKRAEAT